MPGKKILMLTGEFTEEYESFVFQQAMEAVGHTVHVICPDKNAGDVIKTSLHDFEGDQTYTEKPGHNFVINKSFSEVRPEQYDAVYCAGGRGPEQNCGRTSRDSLGMPSTVPGRLPRHSRSTSRRMPHRRER